MRLTSQQLKDSYEYARGRRDGYQECLDKYGWMLEGLLYDEDLPEEYRPKDD